MDLDLRRRVRAHPFLVAGIVGALVVGGALAYPLFAPKAGTQVDQPLPPGATGGMDSMGGMEKGPGMGAMGNGTMANGTMTNGTMEKDGSAMMAPKQGTFRGAGDGIHQVSGTVQVLRGEQGWFLRFENYEATDGPDVYFYLTRAGDARTRADVESGLRVLVPGGAGQGEATLRGNFNVPLPQGFDPAAWGGVAAWCDRFDVLFGNAALA